MAVESHARRFTLAAMMLAILGSAVWMASKRFLADIRRAEAVHFIDGRLAGKPLPAREHFDELQARVNWAAELDPGNPWIQYDLGRFQLMAMGQRNRFDPVARASLVESRRHYANAASLRPTWERAWLGLAASGFGLGEINQEFFSAMDLALRHGPWNQEAQMAAIRIGLFAWPSLPKELQARLRMAIHRQAHWRFSPKANELRPLITSLRRTELLCLLDAAPKGCTP